MGANIFTSKIIVEMSFQQLCLGLLVHRNNSSIFDFWLDYVRAN